MCDVEIFACCIDRCAFCLRARCFGTERRVPRWFWRRRRLSWRRVPRWRRRISWWVKWRRRRFSQWICRRPWVPECIARQGRRVGHAAGISRSGFNRTAGFSRREFSRSAMSGSRSFTSRGFATRSSIGSAASRAVKGRQLASSALAGRSNVTGALTSRNGNLMNGSGKGVGRTAFLRNNAFAAASGRTALASASFRGAFAGHNWWRGANWWHGNSGWWVRDHHPIIAIGWFGGLFWPFAYWDFVDYTFWPYSYDVFWPYVYDDLYVGVFGPYAYEGPTYTNRVPSSRHARRNGHQSPTVPVVCSTKTSALTDWPIQQITELVQPDQAQQEH